jgi:transposase-like protein
VTAYRQSGVSIAALAISHAVNANIMRRWLNEYENSGRRQVIRFNPFGAPL